MKCEDVQQALDAQFTGRLDRAGADALEVHLAGCAACQALWEDCHQLQAELRLLGTEGPNPRAWEQVAARLEADPEFQRASAAAVDTERRRQPLDWRWLALAATLVLLIGSSLFVLRRTLGPVTTAVEAPGAAANGGEREDLVRSIEGELGLAARHYENAIAGLERVARESDSPIDPVVMATVRENLQIIDRAIDDSRQALHTDPESQLAQESLFDAFRRKVALLQDTIALMNEMRKGNPDRATAIASGLNKG